MDRDKAKQRILKWAKVWGQDHLDLASHAAFPLAVTPELLYCLRENFLPDCPLIGVADLLLSPLCDTVGDELYEMEGVVRDILLRRLATDLRFGETRLYQLAEFMSAYITVQLPEYPMAGRDLGLEPKWVALAYARPDDASRLREAIAEQLRHPNGKVRERLATFLDTQEDLLIAAGLEPLIVSTQWQLVTGVNLQPLTVQVAKIVFDEQIDETDEQENLKSFNFETVFVDSKGEITRTEPCQAYYYEEPLEEGIEPLTMIAIQSGEFLMGSPEEEKGRYDDESPQHRVKVPEFFMSQTPITQAQWRAIANLPQEQRELKPNPSSFEGDDCPVDSVSWYDAMEFCARLSRHTGRDYRLPSEAEWEYACRADNSPLLEEEGQGVRSFPFHFGETITSELANYQAQDEKIGETLYKGTYADEPEGEYRNKTTPVRTFKPNAFGLYDMHGNVWEWCLDPWHGDYDGAPDDGSVWDEKNSNDNDYQNISRDLEVFLKDERSRVVRGGSWGRSPRDCRSAIRSYGIPRVVYDNSGFRVVCGVPRT
ncbi:MAG: formylglycine-generating enzyme family protein [Xenococcaceae cyanobacterium]